MLRALELAERGRYSTSPNPMVGCVIVRDGEILGEGFHHRAGDPHAEIEALRACPGGAEGATVYVTLEPCAHVGRTGPCSSALIEAGVARVVAAMGDPNPLVNGKGFEQLRRADIDVVTGILAGEAEHLNEKFCYAVRNERPFVLLKAGITLDGKLATAGRDSRWITGPEARDRSLRLREEFDAILVGGGTVRDDDPMLTRRLGLNESANPWLRVVVTGEGDLPAGAQLLADGGRTLVFTGDASPLAAADNVEVIELPAKKGRLDLDEILRELYERGVRSLLVEGGSLIHTDFLRRRLWQKMIIFVAPMLVGGATAPALFVDDNIRRLTDAHRFRFDRTEMVGADVMLTAYPA
jgi:diaminohydroxyphosphoribosylaminopyrimidine deaminase/5-amino-6-(5-phosphoribosylamino)uracil reductase